jgi:hypothetical protein
MNTETRWDLTVRRNDDVWERPLRIIGPNLTGVDMRAQIRLAGDTPGAPLADLQLVTNGNAEGVRLASVTEQADGTWSNDFRIRLNKSTRQAFPYAGEVGDTATLEWGLLIAGVTRIEGKVSVPAQVYGSDNAPLNRPPSYGARTATAAAASSRATLTISQDGGATLKIDGADLLGPMAAKATIDASRAETAAGSAEDAAAFAEEFGGIAYDTVAAGQSATQPGQFFRVSNGDTPRTYTRYERTAGGSAVAAPLATTASLASGDPGKGSALSAYKLDLLGAIKRNVFDKLFEVGISVKDLGAKGDGVTDDTQSFIRANAAAALLGIAVIVPAGEYRTSANLPVTTNWRGYRNPVIKFVDNLSSGTVATASVASILAENVTVEGITFDGNRANQSWQWQGSANYGLAVQYGGATIINCTTRNVTGNGTGVPTKTGSGRISFINHRSYGNGKKGLHSGAVSGFDVLGGEFHDNENDSGIGLHQGASDVNITAVASFNNGHAGVHVGHSLDAGSSLSHEIAITGLLAGENATADILIASSQAATHSGRIFNVTIVGGKFRGKLVIQAATNVSVTGTLFLGSNIEADVFKTLILDGVKMLGAGSGTRIRCRWINFGANTEPSCEGLHIINPVVDTTGATSAIVVAGTTSGRVINPMYVGAAPSSYYLHVLDNTRSMTVKSDGPVRLGGTNYAAVNDEGPRRAVHAAAAPTSGDWRAGDQVKRTALIVDAKSMVRVGELCISDGSPGTWVPQYISTVSPAV